MLGDGARGLESRAGPGFSLGQRLGRMVERLQTRVVHLGLRPLFQCSCWAPWRLTLGTETPHASKASSPQGAAAWGAGLTQCDVGLGLGLWVLLRWS